MIARTVGPHTRPGGRPMRIKAFGRVARGVHAEVVIRLATALTGALAFGSGASVGSIVRGYAHPASRLSARPREGDL
jgi:hypothetical protein